MPSARTIGRYCASVRLTDLAEVQDLILEVALVDLAHGSPREGQAERLKLQEDLSMCSVDDHLGTAQLNGGVAAILDEGILGDDIGVLGVHGFEDAREFNQVAGLLHARFCDLLFVVGLTQPHPGVQEHAGEDVNEGKNGKPQAKTRTPSDVW